MPEGPENRKGHNSPGTISIKQGRGHKTVGDKVP